MIKRHIEECLEIVLADTPVVLINGARQTGKSTLVKASKILIGDTGLMRYLLNL